MRASKFESVLFVALLSMGMFASSAGATTLTDAAASTVESSVTARAALPHHAASQRSGDIRLAALSPASTAQAATLESQPEPRTPAKDLLLLTLVGGMLVAYQLLRKHRLLRQQPFSL